VQLTFCGAARQVTGSCFFIETASSRFLVDCGLFQGGRTSSALNRAPFLFDPRQIDFVILTHAHIDHSGLLPRLSAEGFTGPVYATQATHDLVSILLPDSAYLQQNEAERAGRRGRDFVAAYTVDDAQAALRQLSAVEYDVMFEPAAGVRARLRDAGHILGSAIVELWLTEDGRTRKIVISGDLGQPGRPILRDPTPIHEADVLLLESTYGNRNHRPLGPTLDELVESLNRALRDKQGVVLVPAFAVGRTQEFLYYLKQLCAEGRLPDLNVFVDSPMAAAVTALTARHFTLFDEEARRLSHHPVRGTNQVRLRFTDSVQDSMALNRIGGGAMIVAGSGMCDGGRIRHHLKHHLPNPRTTVLIIGFQAVGTLGRKLVDRPHSVRIFGDDVPVRAEIVTLGGFSAHADQSAMLEWLAHFKTPPEQLFLVHGEEDTAMTFAGKIQERTGRVARIPIHGESVRL
jgi:metallo-beta-lactamase family protein